jgi:putative serine protease PepD
MKALENERSNTHIPIPQPRARQSRPSPAHRAVPVTTQRHKLFRAALLTLRNTGVVAMAAVTGIAAVLLLRAATGDREFFVPGSAPVQMASDLSGYSAERVAATVLPSVVTLQITQDDQSVLGSGVVVAPDGLIVTNNHVVSHLGTGPRTSAQTLMTLSDGRTAPFDVLAADPQTDIAVVRARGLSGLTPISIGASNNLRIGHPVMAVGSPLGLESTVTDGVISGLRRPVCTVVPIDEGMVAFDAIQTDAAINPGNSGGALVDADGRLVGVNSAEAMVGGAEGTSTGLHGSIGLGFAIPVDQAMRITAELVATGRASHAWLGAEVSADAPARGAGIVDVTPGSPAAAAGLSSGSVLTKVDDQVILGRCALVAALQSRAPNTPVSLTFTDSSGHARTAKVSLGTDQAQH